MAVKRPKSEPGLELPAGLGELPPEDRIVMTTIFCLEKFGVTGTTVRRIADAAGVNVAAINYYFGSKDRLLELVFARTLEEAFPKALRELKEFIERHDGDIPTGTYAFFHDHLRHVFNYPRIAVAQLQDALLRQDYSSRAVAEMRKFVDEFHAVVAPAMPHPTGRAQRLAVLHVWATIFQLAMLPELFGLPPKTYSGKAMIDQLHATLFSAP
jgi:AcrR family transcriptional regulator